MELQRNGDQVTVVRGWSRYTSDVYIGSGQCQLTVLIAYGNTIMFAPGMQVKLDPPPDLPNFKGLVPIVDAPGCHWSFNVGAHFEKDGVEVTAIKGATVEFPDDGSVVTRGLEFKVK
jgi:hypothetical protein